LRSGLADDARRRPCFYVITPNCWRSSECKVIVGQPAHCVCNGPIGQERRGLASSSGRTPSCLPLGHLPQCIEQGARGGAAASPVEGGKVTRGTVGVCVQSAPEVGVDGTPAREEEGIILCRMSEPEKAQGVPFQPARRAISHHQACALSLQNKRACVGEEVWAQSPGRLAQSEGCALHHALHH